MITVKSNIFENTLGPTNTTQAILPEETASSFGATFQSILAKPQELSSSVNSDTAGIQSNVELPATLAPANPIALSAANSVGISAELKNFIDWQGAQSSPFFPGKTIANVWAMQGVTDPYSDPTITSQAKDMIERAKGRSELNHAYTAEWTGDWKTQMALAAQEQQIQSAHKAELAAIDASNNVVMGGGLAKG